MSISKQSEAEAQYDKLEFYSSKRCNEISKMATDYIDVTDNYGRLIVQLTCLLGEIKPVNTQDIVIRDLMADVFDCLYNSRAIILRGKCEVAYPILRRAYESLSLLHACIIEPSLADKWENGKKIGNHEIRKILGKHPLGESEEALKTLYNFFCLATHPNRDLIPYRSLGDRNTFVLGDIGQPDLIMVCDYFIKHLDMWFWLAAMLSFFYKKETLKYDNEYSTLYRKSATAAQELKEHLVENYKRLLNELKKSNPSMQPDA